MLSTIAVAAAAVSLRTCAVLCALLFSVLTISILVSSTILCTYFAGISILTSILVTILRTSSLCTLPVSVTVYIAVIALICIIRGSVSGLCRQNWRCKKT
jgi:hypothetical protein